MDFSVSGAVNAVKGGLKATKDAVANTAEAAIDKVEVGAGAIKDTATAYVPRSLGAAGDALLAIAPYTPMSLAFLGAGGLAKAAQLTYDHFLSGATKADQAFLADHKALPPAMLANLKTLADHGKLSAMDHEGQTLRGVLQAALHAKVDPAVLAAVTHQLADPSTIHQVRDNTCSAAAIQAAIAASNPARYAELATSLTRPPYEATLPNGKKLAVSEANRAWIEAQGFGPEDRVNAYMQAALMDYANGDAPYDIGADATTNTIDIPFLHDPIAFVTQGLNITQARGLADALGNVPILDPTAVAGRNAGERNAELRNRLAQAKKDGAPGFLIPVHGRHGKPHMVMVTDIDAKTGAVKVYDPGNGKTTTIPREKFDEWVAWNLTRWDDIGTYGASSGTGGGARPR
jgi:hypothetical protein